jgi:hypothetical protein
VTILEPKPATFLFEAGDTALCRYNYGFVKQEGASPRFDRCDYLHPILGPEGESITDDFPEDHLHHRGIFWIWPRVLVGENSYDPWGLADSRQWPRSCDLGPRGPICASLAAEFMWRSSNGDPLVREKLLLRAYRPDGTVRIVDLEIRLWAATGAATKIGGRLTADKGYGGLNVRFAPRKDAVITMDGAHMKEQLVNQKEARWSDFTAVFPGGTTRSGITVCGHPTNPAWPERWCNRYYGLLGTASPGLSLLPLHRTKPVIFRYRLVVHGGTHEDARSEGHSRRFASAASVKWAQTSAPRPDGS